MDQLGHSIDLMAPKARRSWEVVQNLAPGNGQGLLPPDESSDQVEKGRDISTLDQERKSPVPSRQELGQGQGQEAFTIYLVRT